MTDHPWSGDELPEVERLVTAFRTDHETDSPEKDLAALVFVLDLQEQLPAFQRFRAWAMERLAPLPGSVAVDVGCGAGAVVAALAERVAPAGRAVGVEPNQLLRGVADERWADVGVAEFVDGDAYALPFEDASVDVLHCERVWQHLADPQQAAHEVARVLRPGGRAVILDSDWATFTLTPGDPDVVRRVSEASRAQTPNPFSGRFLRAQLRAAGLVVDPDIASSAFVVPEELLAQSAMVDQQAQLALDAGAITEEERRRLLADIASAAARGEAFAAVTMYGVQASSPAG
jgi:ubiquinone/menaquinone biosynthesis C-methylase UbiE